jgi:hypothetical protein
MTHMTTLKQPWCIKQSPLHPPTISKALTHGFGQMAAYGFYLHMGWGPLLPVKWAGSKQGAPKEDTSCLSWPEFFYQLVLMSG